MDFPGPGIEPTLLALAGGFLSVVPPGKSEASFLVAFTGAKIGTGHTIANKTVKPKLCLKRKQNNLLQFFIGFFFPPYISVNSNYYFMLRQSHILLYHQIKPLNQLLAYVQQLYGEDNLMKFTHMIFR